MALHQVQQNAVCGSGSINHSSRLLCFITQHLFVVFRLWDAGNLVLVFAIGSAKYVFLFLENHIKKTTEYFLKFLFFLFESTILPVNNGK